ncbi:transglutaminase domain-containing protein [Paenibacillus puldeungensis]|uniref:Transglutaminase domain-containing protein n=1 Tax=Paenibacillus puldeungensis TaxID=696536 RepID=A0ABW3RRJ3_9BACL
MLLSKTLRNAIHDRFIENMPPRLLNREIQGRLQECNEDVRTMMEFFYSTMPASDIGDYDFSLYLKFAEFGLFLADNSPWNKQIPEEIFFNFVLHYRINNEGIEDCRPFFYGALKERISGKSMKEAALEVNIWCAEHVTYQATDQRTASPLTALRSSYGRCGEESTLVVTAMRSVGIPARQVYTPRWAHCDDNHAWVEVWCDGDWYYLGACEPEPVLNRGWFNNASARAMLVDGKAFLPVEGEEVIAQNGQTLILNELSRYADSRRFTVTLKDSQPVSDVTVHFEMLNGSEFFPLASITTDEAGRAGLTLGLGSIHIHAVKDSRFVEALVHTGDTDSFTLDFSKAKPYEPEHQEDFNFIAPKDSTRNSMPLSEEQKELRSRVLRGADCKRKAYAKGFYQQEEAEKLAAEFSRPQDALRILKEAEGNFREIADFLAMDFGAGSKELQLRMLEALPKKDYRDVQCSVLAEHFGSGLEYQKDYPLDIFVPYILSPRAYFEQLTPYRRLLSSVFDEQTKEDFRTLPQRAWAYVSKFESGSGRDHERLFGTPEGILRSGLAGAMGQKVLFVAICRTLGIPARIDPVDLTAQYYEDGSFRIVGDCSDKGKGHAGLILMGGAEKWFYLNNWAIAVLKDGSYQTLELADYPWNDGKLELSLQPGSYRLITSNRTPNGNQFARKYVFQLEAGETKTLVISLREVEISDLVTDISYAPFELYDENHVAISTEAVCGDRDAVLVWLEEGHEPTEHVLNEFIQAQDVLGKADCEIIFIIRDQQALDNETFKKACMAIPRAKVYYSDFSDTAVTIARRMYVDPDNLPLTVVSRGGRGIYACSGYNVGIVGLMIKIINL